MANLKQMLRNFFFYFFKDQKFILILYKKEWPEHVMYEMASIFCILQLNITKL